MALYTFSQLEGLWIQAGGNRAIAPVMAAIAIAESHPPGDATHGDSGAVNPTDNGGRQTSWGLWQISNGTHAKPDPNILNPLDNAKAAVGKLHSQGLGAWGTYTSGAYKHFLSSAAPTGTGQAPGTTTAGGRGSGGTSGTPGSANPGSTSSGSGGGLAGFFGSIWTGLKAGLQISDSSGNTIAADIGAVSNVSDIAQAIAALTLPFTVLANAVDWFFVPSHWIRIFAGIAGIGLGIGGVYELAHAGDDHPTALPAGIAMTGAGGVLLFVAFHNLDPSIKTVGELLADLQGKVQTGAGATTSPQAAVTAAGG